MASRFVELDGGLEASVWAADPFTDETRDTELVRHVRFDPPPEMSVAITAPELDIITPSDRGYVGLYAGLATFSVGIEGKLPAARVASSLASAFSAAPSACGYEGIVRGNVIVGGEVVPLAPTDAVCHSLIGTGLTWLFELDEATLGALFRVRPGGRLHYVRLALDGSLLTAPVVVDGNHVLSPLEGGYQPRAVRVGAHVLFTERRGDYNRCHAIRVMNLDGTGAGDAPWQLPCYGDERNSRDALFVPSIELLAVPGGALLVYAERPYAISTFVTRDFPWTEAIHAVLLDGDGRRGSDVIEVTDEDATALDPIERTDDFGPIGRTFVFGAAVAPSGRHAVVAWYDQRIGGEGVYVREIAIRTDR
jgi:hypothetical protein